MWFHYFSIVSILKINCGVKVIRGTISVYHYHYLTVTKSLWARRVSSVVIPEPIIVKLIKMTCLDEVSLIIILPHCCSSRETNREKKTSHRRLKIHKDCHHPWQFLGNILNQILYFAQLLSCSCSWLTIVWYLAGVTVGVGLILSTCSHWQPLWCYN